MEKIVKEKGIILLDGGMSTSLESHEKKDLSGKLWSAKLLVEDPDAVKRVHQRFIRAGVDIITTISYQASIRGFQESYSCSRVDAEGLMLKSVEIVQQAIQEERKNDSRKPFIAVSLGSYGAVLANGAEYTGNYGDDVDVGKLEAFHHERLSVFSKVIDVFDFFAFETIPSFQEVLAISRVLTKTIFATNLSCWVSFQIRDALHLADGSLLRDACKVLLKEWKLHSKRLFGIGVNCCPPGIVTNALREILTAISESVCGSGGAETRVDMDEKKLFVILYPNSGEEWDGINKVWKDSSTGGTLDDSGAALTKRAREWLSICTEFNSTHEKDGLTVYLVVGGCCRVSPEIIHSVFSDMSLK